jgi:murein DD-endopeptidase MepM/ murein hydrolase activator NlpD
VRNAALIVALAATGPATVGVGPSLPSAGSPQPARPASAPPSATYAWPVRGPVIRAFDPPDTPYGAGHRGIDIAVPLGTAVLVPADGRVAFAGQVAGGRFVSIDHPDGVRTTFSWLSALSVKAGDDVDRGDVLGRTGEGHPGLEPPHLHFGARFGGVYIDPMLLLARGSLVGLIHLAPLSVADASGAEG